MSRDTLRIGTLRDRAGVVPEDPAGPHQWLPNYRTGAVFIMRNVLDVLRTSARERRAERVLARDWRRARSEATTPSARAEIDAIFARHIV